MHVFVTGDIHAEPFPRLNVDNFPAQRELTKDDVVIVAGDFGIPWSPKWLNDRSDDYKLRQLDERSFTTCFVDGNHENYDRLEGYPVETWHGGHVHRINDSVIHLMRGQVFDLDGLSVFTFGGARSHDIEDGILEPTDPFLKDKVRDMRRRGRNRFRIDHMSWWAREMPGQSEFDEGLRNLEAHGNEVDVVITHCPPASVQRQMGFSDADPLTKYLQRVKQTIRYDRWYFGHLHRDEPLWWERAIALYHRIEQIK